MRRAAVLVIHGIGSQPPLATLATVAQGWLLRERAAGRELEARGVLLRVGHGTQSAVRFEGAGAPGGVEQVDVLEFAWQHLVQGRIRAWQVLSWVLATGLAPLDLRRHWRILREAGATPPAAAAVVARQAGLAALLLGAVLLTLALLGTALSALPRAWPSLRDAGAAVALVASPWALLSVALSLVVALIAASLLWNALRDLTTSARLRLEHERAGLTWAGSYGGEVRSWAVAALLLAALAALLALLSGSWSRATWSALLEPLGQLLVAPGVLAALAAAVALSLGARLLVRYVGDIALYVTSDTSSPFHRSRAAIKAAGGALLDDLLRFGETPSADERPYDAVVLVGHSLGSVIAYDLLNQASRRARAEGDARGPAPLLKLRGLLTFGSPLDKVAYFFRERVDDGASVHAQLLSQRHATKRRPSRRDDGPYRLSRYEVPLTWLRWLHLHAPADPISDPLAFYQVDELRVRPYRAPWSAHGRYWRDAATYQALDDLLRAATDATAARC